MPVAQTTCAECGWPLPTWAPQGLCPRCLAGMGLLVGAAEPPAPPNTAGEQPGDTIGPYQLRERLGEGGYGVVYLAEQSEPLRRWVALKILKLGLDTKEVIARFEAERQALALMAHPNVARVLDGGATQSGRPFFVMELVRGPKITEFCDANRLPIDDRLHLFLQVCQASEHAHQKGIVHRDIKPSNVLVSMADGRPIPKMIDFGIAKAITGERLTDKTLFTAYHQLLGTPAYMSPEQTESGALDVDARADIYGLGVLLYELLTGRTAFAVEELSPAGLEDLRRAIREREPLRPSARLEALPADQRLEVARQRRSEPGKISRALRGDLDWIVLKAIEKDRRRRYPTASALARDVQNHLTNRPVLARPPTRVDRCRRFLRRNRLTVLAASAIIVALVAAAVVSTRLFLREQKARIRAATVEQEKNQLLNKPAAEEEKAKAEVDAGHRAATLARVQANWWLNARAGRWQAAASDMALVLQLDASQEEDWFTLAALLVESGQPPEYRKHCQRILERFAGVTNQLVAARAAEACLLMPAGGADLDTVSRLVEAAAGSEAGDSCPAFVKGLAEYRQHHLASAIDWENRAVSRSHRPSADDIAAHAVLALASFESQKEKQGAAALTHANELARQLSQMQPANLPRRNAFEHLAASVLQHEAEARSNPH